MITKAILLQIAVWLAPFAVFFVVAFFYNLFF